VKISRKAFGLGRRYPITNGYRDVHRTVGGTEKLASKGLQ
jgi:NAD+ synthase